MHEELQTLPHTYTECDTVPPVVASFDFDVSGYAEIAAVVERPDGTLFTRVGASVDANTIRFDWEATDWIAGCSQMAIRLTDGTDISHSVPVLVETTAAPAAV